MLYPTVPTSDYKKHKSPVSVLHLNVQFLHLQFCTLAYGMVICLSCIVLLLCMNASSMLID